MSTRPTSTTAHLQTLIQAIGRRTPDSGDFPTAIASLGLFRRNAPAAPVSCLVPPSIVVVVDGAKKMWVNGEGYGYDASTFLLTSLDQPANSEVTVASRQRPCLGLVFRLDQRILAELIAQGCLPRQRAGIRAAGVSLSRTSDAILAPLARLVALLDEPESIDVLAPLIQRELHYRLLMSDQSDRLRQIAAVDGHGYRIAKAIDWLKLHFAAPLRIEQLAGHAQMSASSFHQHFRQLTGMSPLQYQKWLRLSEARRLMLNEHRDVSSAAFDVGYESPSQFSREYSRMFGLAPKRDVELLRERAAV